MQIAAILVLALSCGALALRLFSAKRNLKSCTAQLKEREERGSGTKIRLESPGRGEEALLTAVNALLELREAERADYRRQEQEIRRQISNISHDLRTPLTSILGYLQLLEGDTLTPEERGEYLTIVEGRAKNLQSLITSFYDLSRLEGGEYPLTQEPVELYGLLSTLIAEFYNDFTDKGFHVTVDLAEHLPAVSADPAGVLRVLTNLLRNAVEHGEKRLEISLLQEGDSLVTRFANDAAGLSEEDVSRVFQRCFTADKMRTARSTGLGLAIVKALTEQMGHRVDAELKDGMFVVTIRWRKK